MSNVTKKIGILGGMGPLASAKFVETIYSFELQNAINEQELMEVFLYSKPSIPDRTESFLQGKTEILLAELLAGIDKMMSLGAEKIIICCFTLHHLIPRLPESLKNKIIQLPHILLQEILRQKKKVLLLCTKGTRELKIFERELLWKQASKFIIQVDAEDQILVHKIIYQIKKYGVCKSVCDDVSFLLKKYGTQMWAVGCTEFHLLSSSNYIDFSSTGTDLKNFIDPLIIIAKTLALANQP